MQSNSALGSTTFPPYQAFLLFGLSMAKWLQCHPLDSQGRQRRCPATPWATCPDRQFSQMVPGTGTVGFGACPLPSILSLLRTTQLLPSPAQSLAALSGPGISHYNNRKNKKSPNPEKFLGDGHFHVCLPQHIFSGEVKEEIINTIGSWPLKREAGDFHRQRRNLFFCKYLFLLEGYSQ